MKTNRKGQFGMSSGSSLGSKLTPAVLVIVGIIVVLFVADALVPEAQSAGDSFTDATACGNAGCFFNETCLINSSVEGQGVACNVPVNTTPLGNLFGSQGVVILLIMVGIFLIILAVLGFGRRRR